jgi:predicted dehydrogenase
MARNAVEANQMYVRSRFHPGLVAQVVPSPFGLAHHEVICEMIADGFLGEFRELVVIGVTDTFHDASQPLHWRQVRDISGMNILTMGILHETAMRWAPPPTRVFAQTTIFERERKVSPRFGTGEVTVPDSVHVLLQLAGGGRGIYHFGGVHLFGPGHQIHLYGSRGTIRFEATPEERVLIGKAGDRELTELKVPPEKLGGWRVEEEFIGAIRGEEQVRFTDFMTGVKYMEFTEAVTWSATTNAKAGSVYHPIREVDQPRY